MEDGASGTERLLEPEVVPGGLGSVGELFPHPGLGDGEGKLVGGELRGEGGVYEGDLGGEEEVAEGVAVTVCQARPALRGAREG